MSKTKRLEKEIEYYRAMMGTLFVSVIGMVTWLVNASTDKENIFFQVMSLTLSFIFMCGIIFIHKKVKKLFDKLEEADD